MLVEICANSVQSALNAERGGADRVELCSELGIGGITPSYGFLKTVREQVAIPAHVLIRPRSGDFTYSDMEFEQMKANILLCKKMNFQGVVSGVLHENFTLDIDRTLILKELAGEMKFTFHRAFDWVKDPVRTLELLENIGADYILSSGQQKTALEGKKLLRQLKQNSKSCVILPGGGINASNALWFKENNFAAIHLSATELCKTLDEKPAISMNSMAHINDATLAVTNQSLVKNICAIVK